MPNHTWQLLVMGGIHAESSGVSTTSGRSQYTSWTRLSSWLLGSTTVPDRRILLSLCSQTRTRGPGKLGWTLELNGWPLPTSYPLVSPTVEALSRLTTVLQGSLPRCRRPLQMGTPALLFKFQGSLSAIQILVSLKASGAAVAEEFFQSAHLLYPGKGSLQLAPHGFILQSPCMP